MVNNIKPAQVFDQQSNSDGQSNEKSATMNNDVIQPVQTFDAAEFISESANTSFEDSDLDSQFPDTALDEVIKEQSKPQRWSLLAKLSCLGVTLLIIVQTLLGLRDAFEQSPILFGFYSTVLVVITTWVVGMSLKEWRKLVKLKQVGHHQDTASRLAESMQIGEAEPFLATLLTNYPNTEAKKTYLAQVSVEHNDAERVLLFDELVLSERDQLAKKYVAKYSAESALLLAASPLAVLDMALILWRNQTMISKIAKVYGIELGYWSRIRLIKSIIFNIIYAGTTEVAMDIGTQLLSVEMTGKLSARVAQGLGGGLLTARLGYQAMSLCRPIPFNQNTKPKLSKIHRHLLSELKGLTTAALRKSSTQKEPAEKLR
ncbi:TIGR01620 family protein [Shewanella gaetbuli]|uniref:YcjF family protein n=1 Tax=Shewanella gaetbuli TaxID=220752 RepID=A0A9X2CMQ7_9GAMM|nr:TIGR01620 family protein [Shewanella gaetbuli]MCL1143915.1 YcjF family protein [Shewanella gaetbuli]